MGANKVPMFGLRIPPKLRNELEVYAKDKEKNLTAVILDAIRFYLDNQ
ncbi:hypothetical protein [Nostoc phage A1]|nr:hypothetical protein [Nostoc phage A1]